MQPQLPAEVRSICAGCYPTTFLALHPDVLEVLVEHPDAGLAWDHAAPLLFDGVRSGYPEPQDTAELLDWLLRRHTHLTRAIERTERDIGVTLNRGPLDALATLMAAFGGSTTG